MSRVIEEATATDNPCSSCGRTDWTIYFPIAPTKRAPFAYLCIFCLGSVVDKAFSFNWRRNLEAVIASRQIGRELTARGRDRKRAR